MEKPLVNTQRRERAKVRADVVPSPVGVAMVKVVKPSPPTPIPAQEGPFLTKTIGSGDIGIDDDFDNEHVVVIPD